MNLTLRGFLRSYCRELTGLETDSLRKLLASALCESPAAAEAVMAFAASKHKQGYLASLAEGTRLSDDFRNAASLIDEQGLEGFLSGEDAPERYRKVWAAYLARKNSSDADRRVISLMRERTLEAMRRSGVTAYRICADLGLNRGNVYAYLGGDATKVSRATARAILEHAERLAA